MRENGYWSPPKYPSPIKRKTTKKKQCKKSNQQPKKRKTKKDIPAITNMFREVPPVVDEKGEHSEVQVFEVFNPDEILSNLYKLPPPHCPRCVVPMTYGRVKTPDGSEWKYYRCPATGWTTMCYVTCGVHELPEYLQRVQDQTHPCYRNEIFELHLVDSSP